MKKSYTVAGVGVCLGKQPGCEALAESIITGAPMTGQMLADSLPLAVREALRFTSVEHIPVMTDTEADYNRMSEMDLGDQLVCANFGEMIEKHRKMHCCCPDGKAVGLPLH